MLNSKVFLFDVVSFPLHNFSELCVFTPDALEVLAKIENIDTNILPDNKNLLLTEIEIGSMNAIISENQKAIQYFLSALERLKVEVDQPFVSTFFVIFIVTSYTIVFLFVLHHNRNKTVQVLKQLGDVEAKGLADYVSAAQHYKEAAVCFYFVFSVYLLIILH